jgi:hypothetical protein
MSKPDSTTGSCGCCTGLAPIATESNRPGRPAIAYRLGTYTEFFARMRAQIASPTLLASPPVSGPWSIAALSTRSKDDPAIALLDAWAVVLDVLTFYQERVANEGYLRTATERQSVLELAREIGYELNPGVAASTFLSFLIEDVIGTPISAPIPQSPRTPSVATQGASTYNASIVLLDTGTQVQSVPPQGSLPQTFETASPLQARTAWNLMLPRLTRFADLALTASGQLVIIDIRTSFAVGASTVLLTPDQCYLLNPSTPAVPASGVNALLVDHLFFDSANTAIPSGDLLMLVGVNSSSQTTTAFLQARTVTVDASVGQTRVDFTDTPLDPSFNLKTFPYTSVPGTPQPLNQATVQKLILSGSISESDLQALVRISNWDPALLTSMVNGEPETAGTGAEGAYTFASEASFFGHNAPLWDSLPDPAKSQRSDPYPVDWDAIHNGAGPYVSQNSQGRPYTGSTVYLERSFPLLPGSLAAIEPSAGSLLGLEVSAVADKSLADYNLSGKSTGLTLSRLDNQPILHLAAPSVAVLANGSVVAFASANGSIYQTRSSSAASGEPVLRAAGSYRNPPAVITNGQTRVFATDADGFLYYFGEQANPTLPWTPPTYMGFGYRGTPTVLTAPPNTPFSNAIDVFVSSTDGWLVHFWNNAGLWSGPEFLAGPGSIASGTSPCAVGRGPSTLEVFFINPSGILMHVGKSNADPWWGPAQVIAGQSVPLAGSPTVALKGPSNRPGENNIDVFAHSAKGNLYHAWFLLGPGWSIEEDRGAPGKDIQFTGSPSFVDDGPSPLEVFSIASDGNLYHSWWSTNWFGPSLLGGNGQLFGSPSAIAIGQSQLQVTASSIDGTIYLFVYNGGWHAPVVLGGGLEYYTRSSTLHFNSQQRIFAQPPIKDNLFAGVTSIMLNGFVPGLTIGQAIAITGERADAADVIASEIILLSGIAHHGGFTELQIASPGLQYSYIRSTMTLNANTTLATNGATIPVAEILGGGDATRANQSFTLSRTPLTYVPAATASGSQSTLTIRVNDLLWNEAPSLYGLGPSDRCYITRESDDGKVTVTFGDGIAGARLPSGQNNVSARYRTGIGLAGNIAAGTLSILQSRPPGLRSVNNVLPASGGANPQVLADARTNAPRTVLTIDRIVSASDYEDFSATFAGIGKAQALLLPLQSVDFQVIHITISGGQGAPVDPTSDLFTSLRYAIDSVRDLTPYVHIASYQPALFDLSAALILDPKYIAAYVLAAAGSAVADHFSFSNRAFAQPVLAAEAIAALQAVPGVVAVEMQALFRTDAAPPPTANQVLPVLTARGAGLPAGASQATAASIFAAVLPAELLLLNPIGLKLTEKKA